MRYLQHGATRDNVRQAVYEFTTPFTTRPMRNGEVNGREYLFVTKSQFEQLVNDNRLLEWGVRDNNCYGTPKVRGFIHEPPSAATPIFVST